MGFVNSIFNFLHFKKRNWKAVVLCLFAATVFWFFNALNKNYSANINFPLAFDYNHENFIPVKALPQHVKLNVSGLGWDLFRKSSGLKVPPLIIPLEKPMETRKIVGSTLPPYFSNQLTGLQINFVLTDTLFVEMDEKVRRKINLKLDSVDNYLDTGYGVLNEITLSPDTVWLEGPKHIVNALPSVLSISLSKTGISKNFKEEIEIVFKENELVKRQPPVVEVSFDVEKLIEVSDRVQLKIINAPKRVKPVLGVSEINCTYRIPVSLVKTLASDSLRAVIDLNNYPKGRHVIAPYLEGLPKHAHLVKVDSVQINF